MFKLPKDQDAPDEVIMDEEADSAFHSGFLELETPAPVAHIESTVKNQLTSGTDFDPLPRQIARRVCWIVVPGIVAFLVATGVLTLRPIPRLPLTAWRVRHGWDRTKPDVESIDPAYSVPAPMPEVNVPPDGFHTEMIEADAPSWFCPVVNTNSSPGPGLLQSTIAFDTLVFGEDGIQRFGFNIGISTDGLVTNVKGKNEQKRIELVSGGQKRVQLNVRTDTKGTVTHK